MSPKFSPWSTEQLYKTKIIPRNFLLEERNKWNETDIPNLTSSILLNITSWKIHNIANGWKLKSFRNLNFETFKFPWQNFPTINPSKTKKQPLLAPKNAESQPFELTQSKNTLFASFLLRPVQAADLQFESCPSLYACQRSHGHGIRESGFASSWSHFE